MFWLGVIVSLCYIPGVTGAYIATQWPVLAIALPFGLLRKGPFTLFHVAGLLFITYATVRVFYSPAPQASVFGLWLVLIWGLSLWFGTTLISVHRLYAGMAAGAAISSAVAVSQYFGLDLFPRVSDGPAGLYVNSVQLGTVLALLAVALISERMWLWVFPLLPGIALSGSRGALLTLFVGALGCAVRRPWIFIAIAAAGVFYLSAPLGGSDQERMLIWKTAWYNLTPLGWGPGVFFNILIPGRGGTFFPEYAHNDALQLVFEYGAAALLPFIIFIFVLSCTGAKEWPVVVAFVTAGCYSMPLYMPIAAFLAFVAVGRILRTHALVCTYSDGGGWHVLPWRRGAEKAGCGTLPVASRY